jgi:TPR repeat protein
LRSAGIITNKISTTTLLKYIALLALIIATDVVCHAQTNLQNIIASRSAGPSQYTSPEEIAEYKKLAEEGNIQTMGYLGDMYCMGEATVPKDCEQALKYYHMAVAHNDSSSMISLANCYLNGNCVDKDFQKAEQLFQQAARMGVTQAIIMIGVMYEIGMGKPADYNKALEWYFKTAENTVEIFYGEGMRTNGGFQVLALLASQARAFYYLDTLKEYHAIDTLKTFRAFQSSAEKGNKFAMAALATAYYSGACTPEDTAKGKYWMLKAANAGHVQAMYQLAVMYYDRGDYQGPHDNKVAVKWFLKAAENGYIDGMTTVAIMYYHGRGIDQDYKKAIDWFLKAAAKGNALAMNNLGLAYMQGAGVVKDEKKAFEWLSKAAAQNYTTSMFYLGYLYDKGELDRDYKKAMEWYLKAAKNGNESAMDAIGKLYEDGKGVPQDYKKAVEWYSKVHR